MLKKGNHSFKTIAIFGASPACGRVQSGDRAIRCNLFAAAHKGQLHGKKDFHYYPLRRCRVLSLPEP